MCAEDAQRWTASIVNITSIEAHRAAPGYAVYSAMKAALVNLSQSLALEFGDRMIRINCIAPDVIPTPGIGGEMPVKTPLPIAGNVDDVAAAVLYLASDWSRFVTGTTIHVDGGNWAAGGWGTRRRWLGHSRRGDLVKFGVALGALNPHLHHEATREAEQLELRVGVAARAPRVHARDEPLAAPGRGTSRRCLPTRRSTTRSRTSGSSRASPNACGSAPTCTTSDCATRSRRARGVQTVDLLRGGRFEFGIGASWLEEEWRATQLDFATRGASRRRGGRGVQALVDRGDRDAPR